MIGATFSSIYIPDALQFLIIHILGNRIRLILSILEGKVNDNPPGCGLDLQSFEINKVLLSHFPLHNYESLKKIENSMLKMLVSWNSEVELPLDAIKDYFGERLGLYFAYLQFYTQRLMMPAAIGTAAYIVSVVFNTDDGLLNPYFAAFTAVWSIVFMKGWQQRQSTIAMEW